MQRWVAGGSRIHRYAILVGAMALAQKVIGRLAGLSHLESGQGTRRRKPRIGSRLAVGADRKCRYAVPRYDKYQLGSHLKISSCMVFRLSLIHI